MSEDESPSRKQSGNGPIYGDPTDHGVAESGEKRALGGNDQVCVRGGAHRVHSLKYRLQWAEVWVPGGRILKEVSMRGRWMGRGESLEEGTWVKGFTSWQRPDLVIRSWGSTWVTWRG